MHTISRLFSASAVLLIASASLASAAVEVYISAPQTQTVGILPGAIATTTADFNGTASAVVPAAPGYTSPIGVYTNTSANLVNANFHTNDQYGGNAQGDYLAVSPGGAVSAALTTPAAYFGVFFTAADSTDSITLFDTANNLLGTFSTARLTSFLAAPTVTATNGSIYNSVEYLGQPNGGAAPTLNTAEYYAYLSFVVTSGANIGRVVFSKDSGGSFESDNHSVAATAPNLGNSTYVNLGAVPEPGTLAFCAAGLAIAGGMAFKRPPPGRWRKSVQRR